MSNVCECSRPAGDAFACTSCADTAHDTLIELARCCAGLHQVMNTPRGIQFDATPRSRETALPFDPRLQPAAWAAHNELVTMAREVWEHNADADPGSLSANASSAAIALWLSGFVGWMRYQPECFEQWRSLERHRDHISALVDPPPEKIYLGDCRHCCTPVLAPQDHLPTVLCDECGEGNDAKDITEAMLAKVDGYVATLAEVLGLLRKSGEPVVSERTLRRIIEARKLKPAGTLTITRSDGRAMSADAWRVRDIRGLVEQARTRKVAS